MSSILTARYHRNKFQPAAIPQGKGMRSEISLSRILATSATAQDKPAKPIISENFGASVNSRTCAVNDTKINQYYHSSAQVRSQSIEHVHYRIPYA